MQRLKLAQLDLSPEELLSRSQLRNVLGGSDDGSSDGSGGTCIVTCKDHTTRICYGTKDHPCSKTESKSCSGYSAHGSYTLNCPSPD